MEKVATPVTNQAVHGHAHDLEHEHAHEHATTRLGSGGSTCSRSITRSSGSRYAITALLFLFFGFSLMMLMRWQLAYPGAPSRSSATCSAWRTRPAASCCRSSTTSSARCTAPSWCSSASCRLAFGAFGNYVVPLQIGAPDMAFPKLNMASYWVYFLGGVMMLVSFFLPGGAAQSGWTSYPPLSRSSHARVRPCG